MLRDPIGPVRARCPWDLHQMPAGSNACRVMMRLCSRVEWADGDRGERIGRTSQMRQIESPTENTTRIKQECFKWPVRLVVGLDCVGEIITWKPLLHTLI